MPALAKPPSTPPALHDPAYELRVSAYERVSGWLIALVTLLGVAVGMLLMIWFTNRIFAKSKPVPVLLENIGMGDREGIAGQGLELATADSPELAEELLAEEPLIAETLAMVEEAVSDRVIDLADPTLTEDFDSGGTDAARQGGLMPGEGTGGGEPGIPRWQRWEMFFAEGSDLDTYARQLDFFRIELGVLEDGGNVRYVSGFSESQPTVRTGKAQAEERLYMSWQRGGLAAADQRLLGRAGIDAAGRLILHFYPPDVENLLAHLEQDHAGRQPGQIRKTRFGVRSEGRGFAFFVLEQTPL